jgi:hypothetical protein
MLEPVITSCGHSFDKMNLIKYFKTIGKMICPLCRKDITNVFCNIDLEKILDNCQITLNGELITKDDAIKIKQFYE